jgi:trans-aconitate 2-methyltransferase
VSRAPTVWDPGVYERYKSYRDRPALDLMLRIPSGLAPAEVWDLGCGTGEHAALLAMRHPYARVHGLDASPQMLAVARARPEPVDWVQADIAGFSPEIAPDLIFTNAALQWVPGLKGLMPRLVSALAPGGVLACQLPLSHQAPWYDTLREACADPRWAERLAGVKGVQPIPDASVIYDWLAPLCADVDIWSTTYLHVLEGQDPIVDWMSGTGLRPFLQAFGDDEAGRGDFIAAYRRLTAQAFPRRPDGATLLPFPRLFIVAQGRLRRAGASPLTG